MSAEFFALMAPSHHRYRRINSVRLPSNTIRSHSDNASASCRSLRRPFPDHQPARLVSTKLDWSATARRAAGDDSKISVATGCRGDSAEVGEEVAPVVARGDAGVWAGAAAVTRIVVAGVRRSGTVGEHAAKAISRTICCRQAVRNCPGPNPALTRINNSPIHRIAARPAAHLGSEVTLQRAGAIECGSMQELP